MIASSLLAALVLAALLYHRLPGPALAVVCALLPLLSVGLRRCGQRGHNPFMQIDRIAQTSRLLGWNAGFKVCVSVCALVFCVASHSFVVALLVVGIMSAVGLAASRITVAHYLRLLMLPATFVLLSSLAILFDVTGQPLGYLDIPLFSFYISVTSAAQAQAGLVMAKALGALCCLYALSLTTPMYEITAFLRRIYVPSIIVELMILIYRYIFVLFASLRSMGTAATARLGYAGYRNAWRSFGGIASNLLSCSFKRASASFDAMEARCYDGDLLFLEEAKPVCTYQVIIACVLALCFAAALVLERIIP